MVQIQAAARPSPDSTGVRRPAALALFGLITVTVAAYPFVSYGLDGHPGNVGRPVTAAELLLGLAAGALGLVLTWARPRNRIGWLISLAGLLFALCNLGNAYGARALLLPESGLPGGALVLAMTAPLWIGTVFLPLTLILVRYPTGSVAGTWPPRFERLSLAGFALLYAGYALSPNPVNDQVADAEPALDVSGTVVAVLMGTGVVLLLSGSALVVGDAFRRVIRSERADRTALIWLLTTAPLAAGVIMLGPDNYTGIASYVLVLVAITVGVLRYQALGIEVAVRRTLLYALLTGLVLVAFVGVSAGLAWLLPAGPAPQVIAAALIAVGLGPVRGRLQQLVDRLLYGDRDDPAATLRRLGESMNETPSEGLILAALANLSEALKLDGARIVGPDGTLVAEWGTPSEEDALTLTFAGERLGELHVGGRRGERTLSQADRQLLDTVVPLIAAVVHTVQLGDAVRDERNRVIQATRTERNRLRCELHDGLGPSLTGVSLGLEAAAASPSVQDPRTAELIARLRAEVAASLEEIRRIIDDLRPAPLEGADLLTALRRRAAACGRAGTAFEVLAPARLPPMPAELETAVLRIAEEALTNVVRHAGARRCTVTLEIVGAMLRLEVRDDGVGFGCGDSRPNGVGIESMCKRAERLGGCCTVTAGRGTTVLVKFPLAPPAPTAPSAGTPPASGAVLP